jgi:hypothetical protein
MRPRIKKHPTLVASTTQDETIQDLCKFNRKQCYKEKTIKSYILTCWGFKKTITKKEYDHYISQGLSDLVKIEYV